MGFSFVTEIPSPDVIRERFPLAPELAARKKERDEEIKKIITGESDKLLVIVGPCSADNEEAVVDYVSRLVKVQEKTKDRLVIVPRVYTNKPRTTGEGYMGMIHQPDPEKKPDMLEGILAIRHMHMRVLQETGFSTADEIRYFLCLWNIRSKYIGKWNYCVYQGGNRRRIHQWAAIFGIHNRVDYNILGLIL